MLRLELEKKFKLNEMQEEALKFMGENLIFNAPTGSGKTEAVLLSIPQGSKVSYLLPTITSSIFMYRRLASLGLFNVEVMTSLLYEKSRAENPMLDIKIYTPDPALIEYFTTSRRTLNEVVVMDELDNYPPMVKRVLIDYIRTDGGRTQFIVASATLDDELNRAFSGFRKISYRTDLDFIKFRTKRIEAADGYPYGEDIEEIQKIIEGVPEGKKVGFIFNSIDNLENFVSDYSPIFLKKGKLKDGFLVHHSNVDVDTRNENEKKLFNGDFKVCVSNDIISYSVDIDFDVLFLEMSDRTATNVQRLGRCNRYNVPLEKEKVNVYILSGLYSPRFIDTFDKYREEEKFSEKELNYRDIEEIRGKLPPELIPSMSKVEAFIRSRTESGIEPSLREVPVTFEVKIKNKKYHIRLQNFGEEIPYADNPCTLEFDANGNIVKVNKDLAFLAKRRVCYGYYRLLNKKVPIKTKEVSEEWYSRNSVSEEAYEAGADFLNFLKKITEIIESLAVRIDASTEFSAEGSEEWLDDFACQFMEKFQEAKHEIQKATRNETIRNMALTTAEVIEEWFENEEYEADIASLFSSLLMESLNRFFYYYPVNADDISSDELDSFKDSI